MQTETVERMRLWSTYSVVELHKKLEHLRRSMPDSTSIPDSERYPGKRRTDAEQTYGGYRIKAR